MFKEDFENIFNDEKNIKAELKKRKNNIKEDIKVS